MLVNTAVCLCAGEDCCGVFAVVFVCLFVCFVSRLHMYGRERERERERDQVRESERTRTRKHYFTRIVV